MQVSQNKLAPFRDALAKAQGSYAAALPETVKRYLTPERLTKITLSAISRTPLLLQCTPESVLRAVMDAASLGLEPTGGVTGHAYLVPYRNGKTGRYEAQLIVGYRGLIALARRSDTIQSIEAHLIYEGDTYEISFGLEPKLEHKPALKGERGKPIAAYCVAVFKDGTKQCEVMTIDEIEQVRSRSRSRDNGPWRTDYTEMCRKTVVRRAAKYWPLSVEMVTAMEMEDAAETGVTLAPEAMPFEALPAPSEEPQGDDVQDAHLDGSDEPQPSPPQDVYTNGTWDDAAAPQQAESKTRRIVNKIQNARREPGEEG